MRQSTTIQMVTDRDASPEAGKELGEALLRRFIEGVERGEWRVIALSSASGLHCGEAFAAEFDTGRRELIALVAVTSDDADV